MALTKANLAEYLFEELGLNKREVTDILELFLILWGYIGILFVYTNI